MKHILGKSFESFVCGLIKSVHVCVSQSFFSEEIVEV